MFQTEGLLEANNNTMKTSSRVCVSVPK